MRSATDSPASRVHRLARAGAGFLLLATLAIASTASAATPPAAGEAWPPCDDTRTTWCIQTFEVDGIDVRTGSDWKLDVSLLDGGNGVKSVNWYLGNTGPDAGPNLTPPPGSTVSTVEVVLNTGDLAPRFTMGYGTGAGGEPFALHTGGNAASGYTLHAVGSPIEVEWLADPSCHAGECGDLTTAADVALVAFGGNTQDLGTWGDDAARFDGMWIVTDAQYYSEPFFEPLPDPHFVVQLGNPHLGVDGVTPQVGEFIARVPAGMLEDVGATAAEAIEAGLQARRVQGDTVVEVPSTVTASLDERGKRDGGVILHITDFPYSVAALEVGGAAPSGDDVEPSLTRLAGDDRILTAVAVSQQRFPVADTAQVAVVARADLFPDALAGTPLAAHRNGPLLLTDPATMDERTLAEIARVLPPGGTVHLLGGPDALSQAVEDAVAGAGFAASRLQGPTRYDTAAEIGEFLAEDTGRIYLATGRNFPDALGAGAAAAATNGIVLLTDDTTMPPVTERVIALFASDTERVAVGGQAVAADPDAIRAAGADRYATSRLLAELAFEAPTTFAVASGANFPDGLTGGAHVGGLGGPLVLVAPDAVPGTVSEYVSGTTSLRTGYVYGGEVAIWPTVFDTLEALLLDQ